MMCSIIFFNHLSKIYRAHYMDTDSFVLSFSEGYVPDEHMDLSKLEAPIKTNNKVPANSNMNWEVE